MINILNTNLYITEDFNIKASGMNDDNNNNNNNKCNI